MKKKIRWPLYVIAALIVTFLAFVVPLPYYIEVPGGSEDIRQVLKVNDTEDKEAGAYQFVTVGVQHATLAHMIYAWLTPLQIFVVPKRLQVALPMWNLCELINSTCKHRKIWPNIKG